MRNVYVFFFLILTLSFFSCSQQEQQVDTDNNVEEGTEDTTVIEEVIEEEVVETKTLPEPWPQDFLVQENLEIISEVETEGNLVLVANFPKDSEHPGTFDLYDYYYDGESGWTVPEDMKMSCSSTGSTLTVILGGEAGIITVAGSYDDENLLFLTYTLTKSETE